MRYREQTEINSNIEKKDANYHNQHTEIHEKRSVVAATVQYKLNKKKLPIFQM